MELFMNKSGKRILKQIDSFALRSGDTRSGLLVHAALE